MTHHHRHATLKDFLVDRIRRGIVAGEWEAGEKLPPERWWIQELQVSRVTVRRAFTELRAQGVLAAVHGSGWRVASPSTTGRTRILVINSVAPAMGMDAYEGIRDGLQGTAWRPNLTSINLLRSGPIANFADLTTAAGAIVLLGARLPARIRRELRSAGIPWVQGFHSASDPDAPCVTTDHAASVRLMIDHLAAIGHRRFVYLTHERANDPSFRQRVATFRANVRHRQMTGRVVDIRETNWFDPATGDAILAQLREPDGTWPDTILCSTLMWAEELLLNLTRIGMQVPADVSVAAFGSHGEFPHLLPGAHVTAITRAAFPLHDIGRTGADILLARLDGKTTPPVTRLAPVLAIGDSTAPR